MSFTESLTVQILGDSSPLRDELTSVADLLADLQSRLADAVGGAGELDQAFGQLTSAALPLQQLSAELDLVTRQIQALSQQPITLNVQPALQALEQLMQMAQQAALSLAELGAASLASSVSPAAAPLLPEATPTMRSPPRAYASGGIVTGPAGVDQVPARLTAGEFVLNTDAVAALGPSLLERLNRNPRRVAPPAAVPVIPLPFSSPQEPRTSGVHSTVPMLTDSSVNGTPGISQLRIVMPSLQSIPGPAPDLMQRPLRVPVPSAPAVGTPRQPARQDSFAAPAPQTTNLFGGIEIHVRETADVSELMLDLQRQGIRQRNRRG